MKYTCVPSPFIGVLSFCHLRLTAVSGVPFQHRRRRHRLGGCPAPVPRSLLGLRHGRVVP